MTIHDETRLTTADLASAPPRSEEQNPKGFMRPADEHAVDGKMEAVFSPDEVNELKPQWNAIQTKFIDEPRGSVEEADGLVASTIKRIAESFANERAKLESQWARGDDVSTEDLRLALRRYRSFFDRLLSA
jgi:hypothetical protein